MPSVEPEEQQSIVRTNESVHRVVWQDIKDQSIKQKLIICKSLYLSFIFGRGRGLAMANQIKITTFKAQV